MERYRNEHTIASSCEVTGRGYWSGQQVTVAIHPAKLGTGVRFIRTDLPGQPACLASIENLQAIALRTNLVAGGAKFQMIEHLMAALAALEIDNCVVEVNAEELPGLDGSSQAYVDALSHAGLIIQAKAKNQLVIRDRFRVGNTSGWIEAAPAKGYECYLEYQLSYDDDTPIAPQAFATELSPARFVREVAKARTFVTATQAEQIRRSGVAGHVTNRDLLVIDRRGPIDNDLHFANECARHKTLDLIGDLALAGVEVVGRFTSFRGGHVLNSKMAKLLFDLANNQANQQQTKSSNLSAPFISAIRRVA